MRTTLWPQPVGHRHRAVPVRCDAHHLVAPGGEQRCDAVAEEGVIVGQENPHQAVIGAVPGAGSATGRNGVASRTMAPPSGPFSQARVPPMAAARSVIERRP